MKCVMLSIRPQWCEKIASGKKTIEVRKSAPKEVPFKAYIYATKVTKWFHSGIIVTSDELLWLSNGKIKMCDGFVFWANGEDYQCVNGKVIGEFICDKVYNLVNAFGGIMFADENLNQLEPQLFRDMSCLTDEQTADYLGNKDGYGWHISDLKIYDKPKELIEFRACNFKSMNGTDVCGNYGCKYYQDSGSYMIPPSCAKNGCIITRPPQSYMFVEELKEV